MGTTDVTSIDGSVLTLLTEDSADPSSSPRTLEERYDAGTRAKACEIDHLMSSLDLDFDALAQLSGLYTVSQESGADVQQKDFATAFLANEDPFKLHSENGVKSVRMLQQPMSVARCIILRGFIMRPGWRFMI